MRGNNKRHRQMWASYFCFQLQQDGCQPALQARCFGLCGLIRIGVIQYRSECATRWTTKLECGSHFELAMWLASTLLAKHIIITFLLQWTELNHIQKEGIFLKKRCIHGLRGKPSYLNSAPQDNSINDLRQRLLILHDQLSPHPHPLIRSHWLFFFLSCMRKGNGYHTLKTYIYIQQPAQSEHCSPHCVQVHHY